jgi:hypothetical protein
VFGISPSHNIPAMHTQMPARIGREIAIGVGWMRRALGNHRFQQQKFPEESRQWRNPASETIASVIVAASNGERWLKPLKGLSLSQRLPRLSIVRLFVSRSMPSPPGGGNIPNGAKAASRVPLSLNSALRRSVRPCHSRNPHAEFNFGVLASRMIPRSYRR